MWFWLKEIWGWVEQVREDTNIKSPLWSRVYAVMFTAFLVSLFTALGFGEWVKEQLFGSNPTHLRECIKCRDGYDVNNVSYPMGHSFCPTCKQMAGPGGLSLIAQFVEWFPKATGIYNRNDEIALSVFNAISSKATRERLVDVLSTYSEHNLSDLLGLSELLEEYDDFIARGYRNE